MKILALFIDMLGGEYMNICDPSAKSNVFDDFLRNLGGKIYTNCYTPAPDTPRSSACMWTGVYPKENNCTHRVKWPQRDLNPNIDNIWNVLSDLKYTVNIFTTRGTSPLGLIPLYGTENIYNESIYQFMENAEVTDNSFNFIYLPDVHYILGETQYTGFEEATSFLTNMVRHLLEYYGGIDFFDYVLMFSDHGFQREKEEHSLSRTRTHTFIFEKNKGDEKLTFDSHLRSNLDVFPTLCDKLEYLIKNDIDGKPLSDPSGHEYILMEDMEGFSTNISQTIEHWGVVLKNGDMHWLEYDGNWSHSENAEIFNEEVFLDLIRKKMTDYDKNHALSRTAELYKEYINTFMIKERYSTGEKLWKQSYKYPSISELQNKKILLYGAGNVGKGYFRQIKEENCDIVGWIDLKYLELKSKVNEMICGIAGIYTLEYDYIVIAIASPSVAKPIIQMLQDLGINEKKIIWRTPKIIRAKE